MKRSLAIASIFCLILSSASALTLHTLGVYEPTRHDAHYAAITQAFPDVTFQPDNNDWYESTGELLDALKSADPGIDLFSISDYLDFSQVMAAGLCADLSDSQIIREAVGRMWPSIQARLTREGRIYAIPESILLSNFGWCEDAWQAAGLTDQAPPSSYLELLDFLEMWVERIKKTPEPSIRVNSKFEESLYNKQSYVVSLIPVLLDCYILPYLYENRIPKFDTAEFRGLLDRTLGVAHALYAAEPPPGPGNMQLFDNDLKSFGMIGIKDGYSHAMPLRVSLDQPVLYKASLRLLCVGAGSSQEKLAAAYLEQVVNNLQPYDATYAFRDSQPLERKDLQQDISDQKQRIDKTASQLNQQSLSATKRQELEEQLKRQTQVLESM